MYPANLAQDVRFALRTFIKSPVFAGVAVLSLALGIGANTAIFTLTDQVLLRMLPIQHPERLVMLTAEGRHYGSNAGSNRISYPMYQDFRDHNSVFDGMFCFREESMSLSFAGHTELVSGEYVSGNYFPVLGVRAALGRVFSASDDLHQGAHPVAVLSYSYWQTRFASDPSILGRKIIVNGYPLAVVGVSQPGFFGTDPGLSPQIRVPVMMTKVMASDIDLNDRRTRWITAMGSLKPGIGPQQAQVRIQPYFHQLLNMEVRLEGFAKASADMKEGFLRMSMTVLPAAKGRSQMRQQFSAPLVILMCTVALVLLIACANVANLLIARATSRQKEMAIRLALGASRGRIVSQLLVESVLLSLAGGLAGLALAVWIDHLLIAFLPTGTTPLNISPIPDARILAFNVALSLLTGLLFGLVPALQATRPDLAPTLKDQAGAVVGGGSTLMRKALVVVQVSLSLVLLIGAGLFIRSLNNLKDLDPGFCTGNLIAFKVDPGLNGYKTPATRDLFRRLAERLNNLPGVDSASLAVVPVLEVDEWDSWVTIDSYALKSGGELPDPHMNYIFPGYFKTLEIPLLVGRDFRTADATDPPKAAIVNESFSRKYFKSASAAIGHHIGMGIDPGTKTEIAIIAVSRDTKYESMREQIPVEVFLPAASGNGMTAYVRTSRDPNQIFTVIRNAVRDLDPNLPVFGMITIGKQMENSLVTERLVAMLSTAFGFLATLLAAIGLYGVMAYTVSRRTREIGIRMAVGASAPDVIWLVLHEVLILLAVGVVIALPAAWLLTRYVRSELYGIQPTDPLSIALAIAGIVTVALLSGYLPARRATRIDPLTALRYE